MDFIAQYGIFFLVFLLSGGFVVGSSYVLPRFGKGLSSMVLGFTGISLTVYSWLVSNDPFAGLTSLVIFFCIVLGGIIGWAFIDFKNDYDP